MNDIVRAQQVPYREEASFLPGILLISDDEDVHSTVEDAVDSSRYHIIVTRSQNDALAHLKSRQTAIVIVDLDTSTSESMNLFSYVKNSFPEVEVVTITSPDKIRLANQSIRYGAELYLVKPVEGPDMTTVVNRVSSNTYNNNESSDHKQRVIDDLFGGCESMHRIMKLAEKVAPTASTILISGETGTGKEVLARIIHRLSGRKDERFTAVNCGAIPETLFESELFGHKKGSFTGADRDKNGLVENADRGTLFLDEVGELPFTSQVKLLRFLQERTFRRVGDIVDRKIDVRVIAATNKNLREMVDRNEFRQDLFYRLNVFNLHIPPLRERIRSIPNLVRYFAYRFNNLYDKQVKRVSADAERALNSYDFPGNVRELENIIEHAIVLAEGHEIRAAHLPDFLNTEPLMISGPKETDSDKKTFPTLEQMEKQHIIEALLISEHNYGQAAEKLGVCRATLWRKIKQYGIEKS